MKKIRPMLSVPWSKVALVPLEYKIAYPSMLYGGTAHQNLYAMDGTNSTATKLVRGRV